MRNLFVKSLATLMIISSLYSCDTMNNASKGYVAGTVGGTIIGAGLGAALGGDYGADVGAHLGMAVGGVAGAAVGAEQDAKEAAVAQSPYMDNHTSDTYYDKDTGLIYRKVSEEDALLFQSRSSKLTSQSRKEILVIAAALRDIPFSGIVIYGSADDTESRDYSYELSYERACAVADYFVGLGFNERLISVVGLGNEFPVADNSTIEGRARNRCVEVYIVNAKDNN